MKFLRFLKSISLPGGTRLWITIISLVFLGYAIAINSSQISILSLEKDSIFMFLMAIIFSIISMFLNAIAWKELLKWMGYINLDLNVIRLYISSNILKYIPGGVWHFLERLRIFSKSYGSSNALTAVFLEPLIMLSASLFLVPFGRFLNGYEILFFLPSLLLIPRFRGSLLKQIKKSKVNQIKKLDKDLFFNNPYEKSYDPPSTYPIVPFIIELSFVICRFAGFFCCLNMFSSQAGLTFLQWLSSFSFAWSIGLVVPGAPGGLGVFESAILLVIGNLDSQGDLILALIAYRIVTTTADLLSLFLVSINLSFNNKN